MTSLAGSVPATPAAVSLAGAAGQPVAEVLERLGTTEDGLTSTEAAVRRRRSVRTSWRRTG